MAIHGPLPQSAKRALHAGKTTSGATVKWTDAEVAEFRERGYLFIPSLFSPKEFEILNADTRHACPEGARGPARAR